MRELVKKDEGIRLKVSGENQGIWLRIFGGHPVVVATWSHGKTRFLIKFTCL